MERFFEEIDAAIYSGDCYDDDKNAITTALGYITRWKATLEERLDVIQSRERCHLCIMVDGRHQAECILARKP